MHSTWFSSTFVWFLKFPQIKKEGSNFLGETNSAEWLNYLVPCFVFQLLKFKETNSLPFIRFQFIQQLFSQIRGTYSGKRLNRFPPLSLCFNFESLRDPNFSVIHSITMHCKGFSSTFLRFLKFLQIKDGGHNFL